jgi:hypothetical protein
MVRFPRKLKTPLVKVGGEDREVAMPGIEPCIMGGEDREVGTRLLQGESFGKRKK